MIINNTYFKGTIFLPHANPSITDGITGVGEKIIDFINEYELECLTNVLGYKLSKEFISNIDVNEASLIKSGADAKWNKLLNGETYQDYSGDEVVWRGIRFKSLGSDVYDKSFLANYVYFFFEKDDYITRSNLGNEQEESKNAVRVGPSSKVVKAWNKYAELVRGKTPQVNIYSNAYGIGVDYYTNNNQEICLYDYIKFKNSVDENTFKNFSPINIQSINEFDI